MSPGAAVERPGFFGMHLFHRQAWENGIGRFFLLRTHRSDRTATLFVFGAAGTHDV